MLGFSVTTDFDASGLGTRWQGILSSAVDRLGDTVSRDCEVYVPYDTGNLCRSVTRSSVTAEENLIGCDIIWTAPYASAVYYGDTRGVRFRTEHHAHASARWFEGAKSACSEGWAETVRDALTT